MYPFLWHYYCVSPKLVWLLFILANPNPGGPTTIDKAFESHKVQSLGNYQSHLNEPISTQLASLQTLLLKVFSTLGFVPASSSANCSQRLAASIFLPLNWLMSSQFQVTHCKIVSYSHSLVLSQSPFYSTCHTVKAFYLAVLSVLTMYIWAQALSFISCLNSSSQNKANVQEPWWSDAWMTNSSISSSSVAIGVRSHLRSWAGLMLTTLHQYLLYSMQ